MKRAELINHGLRVVTALLSLSMMFAAWHDASKAWDVWGYHLPFAARIVGLAGPDTYRFGADNTARFDGFPLVAEAVQGAFWRLTGRPEATNLAAFAALFFVPTYLRRVHAVPLHLSVLALLAVPLVQIHATAGYVDLFANAGATLLLLCGWRALVDRGALTRRFVAFAMLVAAVTANAKFQLVPITLVGLAILFVRAAWRSRLIVVALLPLVFATPIKNVVKHGNPVWPVEIHVLGRSLPHYETSYASSPAHLEDASRPVRFVRSVLEIDNRPIASRRRWSIDQWTPHDERGYRMGGFFGAYVCANLAGLAIALWRRRTRETVTAVGLFTLATAVAAMMPQSHELRYYMFWMILAVALNLALWARERPMLVAGVAGAALAIVAWSTSGWYLYSSGDSVRTLVEAKVDRAALATVAPGEHVCVAREPWTFLHASLFHPSTSHVVQEATNDADCAGLRRLP